MRWWVSSGAAFLTCLLAVGNLWAVPIPGLFNTGVDDFRVALGDDTPDSHWSITSGPTPGGPLAVTSAGGFPVGPWLADSATSAWIAPTANTNGDCLSTRPWTSTSTWTSTATGAGWISTRQSNPSGRGRTRKHFRHCVRTSLATDAIFELVCMMRAFGLPPMPLTETL